MLYHLYELNQAALSPARVAADAYRHARQLGELPELWAVMAQQAAFYAETARECVEKAVRS